MTSPSPFPALAPPEHHHTRPPPLPPRHSSSAKDAPPPYSAMSASMSMSSKDPRSSSTQSLVPDPALEDSGRRRLLLIYIHGFMGDETSFRSFPAHVHNLVTVTLADSHVVHTKVYPRYKSRDSLQVARDNFSAWLAPHEDPWTDIILVGHSMGGLLAADIALAFRHRIIGVVNFDVPFLGMHPGIIKAGLGSLFNAPPPPQDAIIENSSLGQRPSRINTLFNPKPNDPNYNPSFANDIHLPNRKGWENSLHWLTKHYKDGLAEATKGLVKSHLEFGGAMADYKELKERYARIRALEEDDEAKRKNSHPMMPSVPRVRFINYYTVSTGRTKKQSSSCTQRPKSPEPSHPSSLQFHHQDSGTSLSHYTSTPANQQESTSSPSVTSSDPELAHVHPDPIASSPPASIGGQEDGQALELNHSDAPKNGPPDLPEIPPIPQEPPFVDLVRFNDKTQRKAAEKEYEQALKEYQRAVKARNKIINERTKLEEKWEKEQQKAEKKRQQEQEKRYREQEKAEQKKHEEEQNMSREERQRQKEREQRQAEAEQREKEARQRQREADLRQGITPAPETPEAVPAIIGIEEDVSALHLDQPGPQRGPYGHYEFSTSRIMNQAPPDSRNESMYTLSTTDSHDSHPPRTDSDASVPAKPKKLKKFCMLPPKDSDGNKDPTWVPVFMENMDEVTAHTSLFFLNETYERLVGEAGARIEEWVREADTMRLIQDLQYQGKS